MKYVAAFLLAQLSGNESPSASDIKKILSSVGIETEASRVEALLKEVSGKSADQVFPSLR
jgi:large subunit ribosomal protein LP2